MAFTMKTRTRSSFFLRLASTRTPTKMGVRADQSSRAKLYFTRYARAKPAHRESGGDPPRKKNVTDSWSDKLYLEWG